MTDSNSNLLNTGDPETSGTTTISNSDSQCEASPADNENQQHPLNTSGSRLRPEGK